CLSDWSSDVCSSDLCIVRSVVGQQKALRAGVTVASSRPAARETKTRTRDTGDTDPDHAEQLLYPLIRRQSWSSAPRWQADRHGQPYTEQIEYHGRGPERCRTEFWRVGSESKVVRGAV